MVRPKRLSRRALLLRTAALSLPAVFGSEGAAGVEPARDGAYRPLFFTAPEWAAVNAFVDRLIPADATGPGALEAQVPRFIDQQMVTPYGHGLDRFMGAPFVTTSPLFGNQSPHAPREIYRHGLAALDRVVRARAGRAFDALSAGERDGVIADLESGRLVLGPVPGTLLFSQFLRNCREGYFSDPVHGGNAGMAAWRMIGFPGARADFTDWVNQGGARYPFGPVSILSKATL